MDERTSPFLPKLEADALDPKNADGANAPVCASSNAINLHLLDPLIPVVSARILNA